MADVQLENGYTRIANEILEQIHKAKLNGTQRNIIDIVWRYTYGFQRKEHDLSVSFIANAIQGNYRVIQRELNRLIEMNIIIVKAEATFKTSRVIAFNKNVNSWAISNLTTNQSPHDKKVESGHDQSVSKVTTNQSPKKESKEIYKESIPLKKGTKIFSNDDKEYKLARYLSECIAKRLDKPSKDEKTLQSWANDFNKMVRLDKYDLDEMLEVLQFSQNNEFWRKQILSASNFRNKYEKLLSQLKG